MDGPAPTTNMTGPGLDRAIYLYKGLPSTPEQGRRGASQMQYGSDRSFPSVPRAGIDER